MATVFISYRRDQTAGEARALFTELAAILGKNSVFMDVDAIALGRDFRHVIGERLELCDLMLALVGRDWIGARNPSGRRRLDDPGDFVRLEIATALKRNIPVTPVLVQGAQMPTVEQLPDDIKDFAYRNGFELSHNRWESDVREMMKRLGLSKQRDVEAQDAQKSTRKSWATLIGVSMLAIVTVGAGFLSYRTIMEEKSRAEQKRAEEQAQAAAAEAERQRTQAERERAAQAQAERERTQAERERAAQAQAGGRRAQEERERAAQAERERAAPVYIDPNRQAGSGVSDGTSRCP